MAVKAPILFFLSLTTMLGSGCSSGNSCGDLGGSVTIDYKICDYQKVVIQRSESEETPIAMIVGYVRETQGTLEWLVKVVANWPVEAGKEKDLVTGGSVEHHAIGGAVFPDLQLGTITFDTLGEPGQNASGKFFATFVGEGGTLNGDFSGTVQRLTPE